MLYIALKPFARFNEERERELFQSLGRHSSQVMDSMPGKPCVAASIGSGMFPRVTSGH